MWGVTAHPEARNQRCARRAGRPPTRPHRARTVLLGAISRALGRRRAGRAAAVGSVAAAPQSRLSARLARFVRRHRRKWHVRRTVHTARGSAHPLRRGHRAAAQQGHGASTLRRPSHATPAASVRLVPARRSTAPQARGAAMTPRRRRSVGPGRTARNEARRRRRARRAGSPSTRPHRARNVLLGAISRALGRRRAGCAAAADSAALAPQPRQSARLGRSVRRRLRRWHARRLEPTARGSERLLKHRSKCSVPPGRFV